ncbi:MAG: prephenate/arogenate dehydrogenase family protein [Alphaproteobacteria bacterium]|nr:prephenate/arogenate dehydrogenase family protein [Alphaproteobacteria bacterium]
MPSIEPLFERVAIIGIGLIGSSLARALAAQRAPAGAPLVRHVALCDRSENVRARAAELGLGQSFHGDVASAVRGADLVMICVPVGAFADVGAAIAGQLSPGAIVSDVGSVKQSVIRDIGPHLPDGVHLVPGHPVAGTEHSGPDAGFATLFQGRWCILTPPPGTDGAAVAKVSALWTAIGMSVEVMEPSHHDLVLAITSHLPHLIAYTIVGTASDMEDVTNREVVKFAAGGFRDFTRIAASDPVMWRDVFLNNKQAVLEMLGRLTEDLAAMQRAIRWGEGDKLEALFTRTRAIRRSLIEAKQA